jgi:phage-related minor tail protein
MLTDRSDCGCDENPLGECVDELEKKTKDLEVGANKYARAMAQAFVGAATSGKQFDEVLKSLALRLSQMALNAAMRPITNVIAGTFDKMIGGLFGGNSASTSAGAGNLFAASGGLAAPEYFPSFSGGRGLAGASGPEPNFPQARGPASAGPASISIQISTPDAESFRRSEAYVTGQIARAVARGQRSL